MNPIDLDEPPVQEAAPPAAGAALKHPAEPQRFRILALAQASAQNENLFDDTDADEDDEGGEEKSAEESGGEGGEAGSSARRKGKSFGKRLRQYLQPLSNFLFQQLLNCCYYPLGGLNRLLMRRRLPTGRPLRVLRIASLVAQGGVAKVAVQSTLALAPEDVRTHVLVFGKKYKNPPALEAQAGVKVTNRKLQLFPGSYDRRLFKGLWKLARIIMKERPDLIHLHEPQFTPVVAAAAGLAGGCPLVTHLHSVYTTRRRYASRAMKRRERHALRRTPLIACSQTILEGAAQWLGWTRHPITLIEDGADDTPNWPGDEALAEDLRRAANGRLILCKMARIVPLKRIDDYLTAARILLDEGYPVFVVLMSYGKKEHARQMRRRFESIFAPHEGEFLYHVPTPQPLLRHVAVGVTCSSLEGLGLNVLEYQVEGAAVVATDIPAHREMVEDGQSGLLYPVGDVPALLRALRALLDDPAQRERIGAAGRQSAERRTWQATAQRTLEFYRAVLGDKKQG